MTKRYITTKKRRNRAESETNYLLNTKFAMKQIEPITENQERAFSLYREGKNLLLCGSAGTGKTYISLYLGLKDILEKGEFKELIIIRSAVQSREQGHMPGDAKEKLSHFEQPYVDIVNDLFGRGDGYQIMKQKQMIRFMSTSFIRGLTFDNAIVIVDESQNCNYGELRTVMTRIGENSRIILCGDTRQDDLTGTKNRADVSGLVQFKRVIDRMDSCVSTVNFTVDDIVRSGLVRDFIIAEEELEAA